MAIRFFAAAVATLGLITCVNADTPPMATPVAPCAMPATVMASATPMTMQTGRYGRRTRTVMTAPMTQPMLMTAAHTMPMGTTPMVTPVQATTPVPMAMPSSKSMTTAPVMPMGATVTSTGDVMTPAPAMTTSTSERTRTGLIARLRARR